jgi:hypothetical protein
VLGDTDYPSTRANVEKVANSAAGVVLMNGLVGFAQLIPLPAYLKYENQKTASPTFIEDFDSDYRTFTRRHMEWSGITRTEKLRELVETSDSVVDKILMQYRPPQSKGSTEARSHWSDERCGVGRAATPQLHDS